MDLFSKVEMFTFSAFSLDGTPSLVCVIEESFNLKLNVWAQVNNMLVGGKIVARGGAVAARLQTNNTKECEASFQETPFKCRA